MYDQNRALIPPIIRAEAEARGLQPTGESAQAGGVMYWIMTNRHALGYDYKNRKYRYRSVAGHHIPLKPFTTRPAPEVRVPYRHRNGTSGLRIA